VVRCWRRFDEASKVLKAGMDFTGRSFRGRRPTASVRQVRTPRVKLPDGRVVSVKPPSSLMPGDAIEIQES
jgi:hypothetical protein